MTSVWAGRRVLITGHTGFKGGWLSLILQRQGADVVGLSLIPPTEPSLFHTAEIGKRVKSHLGDIRSPEFVAGVIEATQPEIIFHLAAQAQVRRSYEDPLGTFATNVLGTVHMLEAARNTSSVLAIINVTSDKCYENREIIWGYREYDKLGGHDPYSSSKGCAELVAHAYRSSFLGNRLVSVRAGNVVGGGDWSRDRLVPDCIRAFSASEKVMLRSPKSQRPWQHVLEPLFGYTAVAERILLGGPVEAAYNFGPPAEETHSVEDVVSAVAKQWGGNSRWAVDSSAQPPESRVLVLDSSLARASLGWKPKLRIDDCVAWTVEWYRRYFDAEDMHAFSCSQIDQYRLL